MGLGLGIDGISLVQGIERLRTGTEVTREESVEEGEPQLDH